MGHPADLQTTGQQASAATWPFFAISTLLFLMRSYSRLRLHTDALGWDDLVISFSWVLCLIRAISFQLAINAAERISLADFPGTVPSAAFWSIFTYTWAFVSIALPKLGVGILINRVFRPARWLRQAIIIFCIFLNVIAIVGLVITFVECNPVDGQWDPYKYRKVTCWNRNIQLIYACILSGISAFADCAFTVYPSVIIWRLQMPKWTRISTIALMGLGFASFAFAIVKLWANTRLMKAQDTVGIISESHPRLSVRSRSNLPVVDCVRIAMWSSIENDFVLSAACLPAVPPCIRASRAFLRSHSLLGSRPYRNSILTFRSSRRSTQPDSGATELVRHGEPPGMWGIKVGVEITHEMHPA
ncbi:uncharacterized protein N7459_003485 [Penicillium hispanicum]|uniref:uncharacterized protein n=1 Tax=Penicillium hispanicum TaxID=1080232 RepID=UPI00253FF8DC|nr:uncharacterized protein N7459_003485 [Penicillium hispanicum]KAJ5587720.1 hypothetical protein N7459_003485 [Penicillium hispanicum]